MSTRIVTLFGDEVPVPPKPAPKTRAKKKDEKQAEEQAEPVEDAPAAQAVAEKQPEPLAEVPIAKEAEVDEPKAAASKAEGLVVKKPKEAKEPKEVQPNLPEDWDGNKTYYGIGEVAEFFKVKTSHIRFWTNEFKLKVRTTRKGDRLYTPEQVKELRAIYHLVKERGFKLSGAKAKLKAQNKHDVETVDLKTSLLQLKNKLVILRDQLL